MTVWNSRFPMPRGSQHVPVAPRRLVAVRAMDVDDLPFVARVHRECLPGGFFADLGDGFLRRYHQSFVTSPASVALIGEVDGDRAGFLVGTVDHLRYTRHVGRHHRTRLVAAGGWALMRRPGLTGRLLSTRIGRYATALRRVRQPLVGGAPRARFGVLSHIAVDGGRRRAGVGRALVDSFVGIARLHGTQRLELLARGGSDAAESFYPLLGWTPGDERRDRDGTPWIPFTLEV